MGRSRLYGQVWMAIAAVALLATSGCIDGSEGRALGDAPRAGRDEANAVVPDRSEGLWDGRPSLGGVWIAHPDVASPRRVLIRNTATGRSTTGSLFRRERDVPGPALQVSSEAAAELGMLAGTPAPLVVTATPRSRRNVPDNVTRPDGPDVYPDG